MNKLRLQPDFIVDHRKVRPPSDRREWPRYPSRDVPCWLGWWQGGRARVVPARIRDVSQGGAAVVAELPPPGDRPVWLCPAGGPVAGSWIEGTAVRVSSPGRLRAALGWPHDVGIRFREGCPWEALRVAMFGGGVPIGPAAVPPPALPNPGEPSS